MFKYPCYWVSIDQLYDAMIPPDPSTSQPRGYVVLSELHLPIPSSSMTSSNLLSLNVSFPWLRIFLFCC